MTLHTTDDTVQVQCGQEPTTQNIEDLFVSIDLTHDAAYVVYDCRSALHWQEIPRREAELLVAVGAHALVDIGGLVI